MGIGQLELKKSNSTLIEFDGKDIGSNGSIKLPVTASGMTQLTSFLVIDSLSAYNVILWRLWIHAMKAIPSTALESLNDHWIPHR